MGTSVETIQESALAAWESAGCEFRIEFSPAVQEEIRSAVVDAFYSVPRGGVEIGGVLYGHREPGRIRIVQFRAMRCEHAFGPSFHLSAGDRTALEGDLVAAQADPVLQSMSPVGWYHSHTRSDTQLRPRDIEIYDQYFPEAWQVALVVRPVHLRPACAALFFRDAKGRIQTEVREFVVECSSVGSVVQSAAPDPAPRALQIVPDRPRGPDSAPVAPPDRRRARWLLVVAGLLGGVVAGGFAGASLKPGTSPEPLGLSAVDVDGKLLIFWNRLNPALRACDRATLEIREDGVDTKTTLSRRDREQGFLRYDRRSERLDVLLTVSQGGRTSVEESGTFAGPIPVHLSDPTEGLRKQAEALRLEGELKDLRNQRLQREVNVLRRQLRDQ